MFPRRTEPVNIFGANHNLAKSTDTVNDMLKHQMKILKDVRGMVLIVGR